MSLCDVCLSPGACCKRMTITGADLHTPISREKAEHILLAYNLPFIPAHQKASGIWQFSCIQLQKDGRCGIYEDRPQLCKDFVAGSDPLCVHHWRNEDEPNK
jgi:Fe-S-cluster containining protein